MKNIILCMSLCVYMAACQPQGEIKAPDQAAHIAEGRAIVEANCASCHSVGISGISPRQDAPPLRTVLATYNAESLADDFREAIHVGHPEMPDFNFGPKGTDEVIAYLKSIQESSEE
jgi:mono/diheme cytochrome c family protein